MLLAGGCVVFGTKRLARSRINCRHPCYFGHCTLSTIHSLSLFLSPVYLHFCPSFFFPSFFPFFPYPVRSFARPTLPFPFFSILLAGLDGLPCELISLTKKKKEVVHTNLYGKMRRQALFHLGTALTAARGALGNFAGGMFVPPFFVPVFPFISYPKFCNAFSSLRW